MSKHTPGPWHNEELPATGQSIHGSRCVSFIVARHENVADVCDSAGMPEAEARANARLICAAPELLEALKECADRLQFHLTHTEDLIAHMKACKAIQSAEGTKP